jgi:predicted nicotinamide N-methyase
MKLNVLEFLAMNNPVRAGIQRRVEAPTLLGAPDALRGLRVLELGCGRGVGVEILFAYRATQVFACDLNN